jgi:sulfite reductase alpha subunit-like flavoprotein
VAAKKLYRRLEALGASPLLPLALGDDQAAGGYEAGVDPALCTLWESLGAAFPLPLGATEVRSPIGRTGRAAAQAAASWPPGSALEAAAAAPGGRHSLHSRASRTPGLARSARPAALLQPPASDSSGEPVPRYLVTPVRAPEPATGPRFGSEHEEEIAAAAALDTLDALAAGLAPPPQPDASASGAGDAPAPGPGRPHFARLLANERLTAPGHWQDVRHLELDLAGSGVAFDPGDVLAVTPRQDPAAVAALLQARAREAGAAGPGRRAP